MTEQEGDAAADGPRLGRRRAGEGGGRSALPRPEVAPVASTASTAPPSSASIGAPTSAPASTAALTSTSAAVDAVAQALAAQAASTSGEVAAVDERVPHNPLDRLSTPAGRPAASAGTEGRARTRQPRPPARSPFWRFGFPLLMLAFVLLIPALAYAGKQTVLKSTDGKLVSEVDDPALPRWRAITDPTPTLLLVQTDATGKANAVTVLSLTGDGAGGVVFVPVATVLELADLGRLPLNVVAEKQGIEGLQKATEGVLGVGMQEVAVVSPAQWTDLVSPVGALSFTNPDDVTELGANGQKHVLFPKGAITLEPKDVGTYLATTSPGENDLNRLVRHSAFWSAWLRKVGTSGRDDAVPGERDSGLGRFIRALAADRVQQYPLPVEAAAIPGSSSVLFVPLADQVRTLVATLIPFPIGAPPGARPRVRLLDGVGTLEHGLRAAPLIVEGNGQIDQIGNADAFGVEQTQIIYGDDARKADAERLQQALGVGAIVKSGAGGTATDVTVVLGKDFAAHPPRSLTVSTAPSGTATTTIVGVSGG